MLIEVTGTLDQPEIDRRVFPRLDEQLAQLFPELARNGSIESKSAGRIVAAGGVEPLAAHAVEVELVGQKSEVRGRRSEAMSIASLGIVGGLAGTGLPQRALRR